MPLPRVPKIRREALEPSEAPDWKVALGVQDPYDLGPSDEWLRIVDDRFPKPSRLEQLTSGEWKNIGEGVFRIHAYLAPDRAVISRDQEQLGILAADGSERVVWGGPKLVMVHGGARWGDNWMFAAAALPDGRWLAALPATTDADPKTCGQELVLFDEEHERITTLLLPERTDSAVKKGHPRRFVARQLVVVAEGRIVLLPDVDVLAVGVYEERLEWIGKTTMHSEGRMWSDGRDAIISNSVANENISWWKLVGLEELWRKRA